jgi:hypothetical protein
MMSIPCVYEDDISKDHDVVYNCHTHDLSFWEPFLVALLCFSIFCTKFWELVQALIVPWLL